MLNIGGGELIIILLVALVVLGPERLPQVARQVGQTVNSLRGLARGFQSEIEAAAQPSPLTAPTAEAAPSTVDGDLSTPKAAAATSDPIPAPPVPFASSGTSSEDIAGKARQLSANMPHEVPEVATGGPDGEDIELAGDEEE